MKWFKHDSDAHRNQKLEDLIALYGVEAYGVYWIILELIAEKMDKSNKCSLRLETKKWARKCNISLKKFEKTIIFLSEFSENFKNNPVFSVKKDGIFTTIECNKLLIKRDDYTRKS